MDNHLNYYQVRWENFKGFKDTGWVNIKPLTIVLGNNNSGKTSFLAPFLLMNQTLVSRDPKSPLIINGEVYNGGSIQELINDYDLKKDITLSIRYHVHESDEKLKRIGNYPPGGVVVTLGVKEKNNRSDIIVKKESVYDVFNREFFSLTKQGKNKYILGGEFAKLKMNEEESKAIETCKPVNFLFNPNTILTNLEEKKDDEAIQQKSKGFSNGFTRLLSSIAYNYSRFRTYIGDLSYIGPVREHPHRIYETSNERLYTVGTRGQNMATLLEELYGLNERNSDVDKWIKKFDFGDWLQFKPLYSNVYSIRFRKNGTELYTNIANAGFGASQVLPLIIQALVSPKGSITIAEQPEIHLNPVLQCELADLFSFMVKQKQRVLIETHSEHMLLRLRKLVAEREISNEDIAIYFVEKESNQATIREIPMDKDGHIKREDWPNDFFGDALRESMSLARQQIKNNKQP